MIPWNPASGASRNSEEDLLPFRSREWRVEFPEKDLSPTAVRILLDLEQRQVFQLEDQEASFRDIFMTEMDRITYLLEERGMCCWFTTEVDGCEVRLFSPR